MILIGDPSMRKFLHGFFSFGWLKGLDFLPPLLFRFFLAPIFWVEGSRRLGLFTGSDVSWYPPTWIDAATYQASVDVLSNAQGLVSVPVPSIMNGVIGGIEVTAALFLILGFAVRWISLPLLGVIMLMGLAAFQMQGSAIETATELLMTHGYQTPLKNGIESAIVLLLMVLALFFMGAGRFLSIDWWIYNSFCKKIMHDDKVKNDNGLDDPFDLDTTD